MIKRLAFILALGGSFGCSEADTKSREVPVQQGPNSRSDGLHHTWDCKDAENPYTRALGAECSPDRFRVLSTSRVGFPTYYVVWVGEAFSEIRFTKDLVTGTCYFEHVRGGPNPVDIFRVAECDEVKKLGHY